MASEHEEELNVHTKNMSTQERCMGVRGGWKEGDEGMI